MDKKKMMHGMVGCRLRTMDGGGNPAIVKEEKIVYTDAAEEEPRDGRIAQTIWHNKEIDGKNVEDCMIQRIRNG